jgi:hypothetical protein
MNFLGMCCLPVSIVVISVLSFYRSKATLKYKLAGLNHTERKLKEMETFQTLFELIDVDQSGYISVYELMTICKQLGWNLNIKTMVEVLKIIGLKRGKNGELRMYEKHFLKLMFSGTLIYVLKKHKDAHQLRTSKNMDKGYFLHYTAQLQIYANSLSTGTQLLLLAHTPLSTKVFRFFQCQDLAGKSLLVTDYSVDCGSDEYMSFMPLVLFVMFVFTFGLPLVLSLILWKNWDKLYSARIFQKMGWLYESFTRKAEWWQIHDVLMKMILTGLLIYVPTTSRAVIASLLCVVTVANVNYFQPHKNRILFWLTQLSFLSTSSKYTLSLLLVVDKKLLKEEERESEEQTIGQIMIALDIFFMFSSMASLVVAFVFAKNAAKELVLSSSLITSNDGGKRSTSVPVGDIRRSSSLNSNRSRLLNHVESAVVHDKVINVQRTHKLNRQKHQNNIQTLQSASKKRLYQRLQQRKSLKSASQVVPGGAKKRFKRTSKNMRLYQRLQQHKTLKSASQVVPGGAKKRVKRTSKNI